MSKVFRDEIMILEDEVKRLEERIQELDGECEGKDQEAFELQEDFDNLADKLNVICHWFLETKKNLERLEEALENAESLT